MNKVLGFIVLIFFCSCATSYKSIDLSSHSFTNTELSSELSYAYNYDLIRRKGNSRYGRKEEKYGIKVVGVKIQNLTQDTLSVNDDLDFSIGSKNIYPLESSIVIDKMKQPVYTYLLYGLLWLDARSFSADRSILIPIGPVLAGRNMIVAGKANRKFRKEFEDYNLVDRRIAPDETVIGFIAFRDVELGRLMIAVRDQ